ncbi:hypothetical protein NM208_g1756 [Fusarium decemcellulare]|uniref:Uncharacterized protein n=1 Tax=Fusarium decemcellulare TaxID=57161 RepID=A0ACC1SV04_9HYPO|nr:hypothetical protein NM208_g1756 [Fusarium decemcellulare]
MTTLKNRPTVYNAPNLGPFKFLSATFQSSPLQLTAFFLYCQRSGSMALLTANAVQAAAVLAAALAIYLIVSTLRQAFRYKNVPGPRRARFSNIYARRQSPLEGFMKLIENCMSDKYSLAWIDKSNVYDFSKAVVKDLWVRELFSYWAQSLEKPFHGVTSDGVEKEIIYPLEDQGATTLEATAAGNWLIEALMADEKLRALHDLKSEDWLVIDEALMRKQCDKAQKSYKIHEPEKPDWNTVDQRHLAGTGKDNAVVPYEGIVAIAACNELLPLKALGHFLGLPVVLMELDHHSGIYLTNQEPDKYHIHTIQRLPKGGDYGQELIRKWKLKNLGKHPAEHMEYIRPFDEDATTDTGFPQYQAQIVSNLESGIILAIHIGEGGCGPGLHYHHSDQLYYLARGSMKVRLGGSVQQVNTGSLVIIPAGLPHRNWNEGPGPEAHLEMIIPALHRLKQISYMIMIEKPEDIPEELRASSKGYVIRVDPKFLKELLPGFKVLPLADPSPGSRRAVVMYPEVGPEMGEPPAHVHEFDQYYFVLEGELTIDVALQKHRVTPNQLVKLPAGVLHRQYNQAAAI